MSFKDGDLHKQLEKAEKLNWELSKELAKKDRKIEKLERQLRKEREEREISDAALMQLY